MVTDSGLVRNTMALMQHIGVPRQGSAGGVVA